MGIAIALVFLGYVAAAVVVIAVGTWYSPFRPRIYTFLGLTAVAVLLPVWDHYPGKMLYSHLCDSSAGIHVYGKPIEMGMFHKAPGTPTLGDGPEPFCDEPCKQVFQRYYGSPDYAPVLSIPGFFIETTWRKVYHSKDRYARFWIDRVGAVDCITPLGPDLDGYHGYAKSSCIAGRFIEEPTAYYTFIEYPFMDPLCGDKRCGYYTPRNALGILVYELRLNGKDTLAADITIYSWKGGWVTGIFTPPHYCPYKEGEITERLLKTFYQPNSGVQPTPSSGRG